MNYQQVLHREHEARKNRFFPKPIVPKREPLVRDWLIVATPRLPGSIRTGEVITVVAKYYGIAVVDILSARRTNNVVRPRQVAMYLAKTLTLQSLPEIGRRCGDRDHTTVLHAVRRVQTFLASDATIAKDIAKITETLTTMTAQVPAQAKVVA